MCSDNSLSQWWVSLKYIRISSKVSPSNSWIHPRPTLNCKYCSFRPPKRRSSSKISTVLCWSRWTSLQMRPWNLTKYGCNFIGSWGHLLRRSGGRHGVSSNVKSGINKFRHSKLFHLLNFRILRKLENQNSFKDCSFQNQNKDN